MERLTTKKIDLNQFSEKAKERLTKEFFDRVKLYNKLCEFEDFIEEMGFEDLETFRMGIKLMQSMNSVGVKQFAEMQLLKQRWTTLRKWIVKQQGYMSMTQEERFKAFDDILEKMHELEYGE